MSQQSTPSSLVQPNGTPQGAADQDIRRSALVAGVGILAIAVIAGIANFGVIQGLVTKGDAGRTAQDILASAGSFRLGIAALIVVAVLDVIVAWALLTFFAPVNKGLATLAAWFRFLYAGIFAVAIAQLMGVLPLLGNVPYLTTYNVDQRQAAALLKIQSFHDIWNVSLVFFGLHLVLIGYLSFMSGYVPRVVGVLIAIAGVGYLIDSFGAVLVANYAVTVAAATFIGEVVLMVWLLVKGRKVSLEQVRPLGNPDGGEGDDTSPRVGRQRHT